VSNTSQPSVDHRLAKALSHPLRVRLLAAFNEGIASPNQLAKAFGESLPKVSYHVKMLAELGYIELVDTAQRRGAIEHYYRALTRPFFSDADWQQLPPSARQAISAQVVEMIAADAYRALTEGSFDAREDRYLIRAVLNLDERAWQELNRLLGEVSDKALELEAQSASRAAEGDGSSFSTNLVLMHYGRPGPGEREGPRSAGPERE
jgi:DNA-binding transcriptional ArsR family regulator